MEGQTRLMNERLPIEEGAIAVLRRGQPLPVVVLNPPWLSYAKGGVGAGQARGPVPTKGQSRLKNEGLFRPMNEGFFRPMSEELRTDAFLVSGLLQTLPPRSSLTPASRQQKRDRPPSRIQVSCLGEGGSPFFRCYGVAKRPEAAYKRERGLPLVPNPGPRTQTLSKEWYSLPITREATNGQPPFRSPSFALGPGAVKPRGRRRLALTSTAFSRRNHRPRCRC